MPTGTPKVTLNGIPLGGAQSYGWPLTSGVSPHRELWTVTKRLADRLQPLMGKPQTFKIEGPRETYEVKQLYPLRLLPNANPNLLTLEVVDRRWLLSRQHVTRHFNIRRITGRKRFNDDGGNLQEENAVFDAALEFAAYSLYLGETPWTPRGALGQVLLDLFGIDSEIRDLPVVGNPEIRDLRVDDSGDAALSILLSQFPGAALFIARDGTAVVYDQLSGKEKAVFDSLPPPQDAGSVAGLVDYRHVRPSAYHVLFTPELEVRVDAYTGDAGTRTPGQLQMDPIAQSVDGKLDVIDPVSGDARTVGLGSWENSDALYTAWGGFGHTGRTLSNEILAKHAASGFKQVEWEFATNAAGAPDDQSARRIGSAIASYRRDFALDEESFGKMESLRPHRVGILNRLFGTRAPSPVYTDWIRIPTWKGISEADKRGWDVAGGVSQGDPLSGGQMAPAHASEIAPGTFRFEPRQQDWGGLAQATYFGRPTDQIPTSDLGGDANRTGSDYLAVAEALELQAGFRLSSIMTAVPGLPNNTQRLYSVEVTPEDAARRMGRVNAGPSLGPPMTIRVPAALMTAKFAYSDARADSLADVALGETTVGNEFDDLLVNEDFVREFAVAAAATVASQFVDRPLGSQSVDMQPGIEPTGALSRVGHEMTGGVTRSVLTFTEPAQLASVFRFLDQGVRRTVLGTGQL